MDLNRNPPPAQDDRSDAISASAAIFPPLNQGISCHKPKRHSNQPPQDRTVGIDQARLALSVRALHGHVALAGIVGFPLLWPTVHNSILAGVAAALVRLAGG